MLNNVGNRLGVDTTFGAVGGFSWVEAGREERVTRAVISRTGLRILYGILPRRRQRRGELQ
jgi:hypothetical protein